MGASFKRNPAVWVGAVTATILSGIGVATSFGLTITPAQLAAIAAFLAAAGSFVTRAFVYAPVDKDGNPIELTKAP